MKISITKKVELISSKLVVIGQYFSIPIKDGEAQGLEYDEGHLVFIKINEHEAIRLWDSMICRLGSHKVQLLNPVSMVFEEV